LTGGWALYTEAPQTIGEPPLKFQGQSLGTDGTRVAPYPGEEIERSFARARPSVLPSALQFSSWHVDEGGENGFDVKKVRLSVDGGKTWQTLVDCEQASGSGVAFCLEFAGPRAADDWDEISIDVPEDRVGQLGIVELSYDTVDDFGPNERGWFVDDVNFGTRCACSEHDDCDVLDGICSAGTCAGNGDCVVAAQNTGVLCGADEASDCDGTDTCNGFGYCNASVQPNVFAACDDCSAGAGACNVCEQGGCLDCDDVLATNDFSSELKLFGWELTGDWRTYFSAPPNTTEPDFISLSGGPLLGTDGNRVSPYTSGPNQETEVSTATSRPGIVPIEVTFNSWHVDEGGIEAPDFYDNKIIEISVDGGRTWNELANCAADPEPWPFCTPVETREGDALDAIVLDTSEWEGEIGMLRFTYDSFDDCCGFERGWYIDDLNWQLCEDPLSGPAGA
jgi:hypothetical protein